MLRLVIIAAGFGFLIAGAQAQEPALTPEGAAPIDQMIYKGVTGNLLEAVPMEAHERVTLQRANAVISSPITGRSLAVVLGVSGPGFIVGGLIWGLWAAMNIENPKPDTSWLGAPERQGLGFCSGPSSKSCQLHLRHEATGNDGLTS